MMARYDQVIARSFALGMLPVAILLLALFGFLVLAEALEDVGQGRFTTTDAILVTALRLPRILIDLLPVVVLLGGLLGLGRLAAGSELIALRAAGQSPLRQARPALWVLALIIAADVYLSLQVIPGAELNANRLSTQALAGAVPDVLLADERVATPLDGLAAQTESDGAFWTRDRRGYLRVNGLDRGRTPLDIEIYRRNDLGAIVRTITAARAIEVGTDTWLLEDVRIWEPSAAGPAVTAHKRWRWPSFVQEAELSRLILPAAALSPVDLRSYIDDLDRRGLDSQRYRVAWWQSVLRPLSLLAMTLLAVAMVQGSLRRVPLGSRVALGALLGVGNYLFEQSSSQLAVLLGGNALAIALLPRLLLLALALGALARRTP